MLRKYTSAVSLYAEGTLAKKSGTRMWTVCTPFVWFLDYENKKGAIVVPVGFEFDFGSIPQPLRWGFDPTRYLAYLLHDYMYSLLKEARHDRTLYKNKRKEADDALYDALRVEGMPMIKAWLVWVAVRLFGGMYQKLLWKNNKE